VTAIRVGLDAQLACTRRPTGVEHYARSLLRELLRLDAPDLKFYLYLSPFADPGCEIPETAVKRVRPDVNTLVKQPWLTSRTWLDRLQVIYSFGHQLPALCRGRQVVTVYDTAFDLFPDTYAPGAAVRAHREVAASARRACRIQVPSQATRRALASDYGYPEDRVDVFLGGYRECFVPGPAGDLPAPLQAKLAAGGIRPPFILSVGRLDRRKNVERVIEAYRILLARGVECGGLVIVGPEDSGSAEVRRRLTEGRVEGERIVTTGYLGDAELAPLYRAAAVNAYPSLAEGFGLPVLESLASGTPTITSNVSSLPEAAGAAALLVDPHDVQELAAALTRVLTEPGLRADLAAAGPRHAAAFTWRRSAELLLAGLRRAAAPADTIGRGQVAP
jgi:glycosyltransferase involved in cell wall biosynthesis